MKTMYNQDLEKWNLKLGKKDLGGKGATCLVDFFLRVMERRKNGII